MLGVFNSDYSFHRSWRGSECPVKPAYRVAPFFAGMFNGGVSGDVLVEVVMGRFARHARRPGRRGSYWRVGSSSKESYW